MGKRIELQNNERMKNTRLTYLSDIGVDKAKRRICLFVCDCGKKIKKPLAWVRHNNTFSCGCLRQELTINKNLKHGCAKRIMCSGAYRSWQAMSQRVKINPLYKNRNIDKRWCGEDGFKNFLADMGERPKNKSIERRDNAKGYSRENCCWATRKKQMNNTTKTVYIAFEGRTYPQTELIQKFGVSYGLVKQRMNRGMARLEAIITPIKKSKSSIYSYGKV